MSGIKVIAFDLFGTVFNADSVPTDERRAYVRHVRKHGTPAVWEPLLLPESWKQMPAHPDSAKGIATLRANGFEVVTLTNWPEEQIQAASANAGIVWDHMVLLERHRVYKPSLMAYAIAVDEMACQASEILMVTANPGSGDDTRPALIGMPSQVVRGDSAIKTIVDLAIHLGVAK